MADPTSITETKTAAENQARAFLRTYGPAIQISLTERQQEMERMSSRGTSVPGDVSDPNSCNSGSMAIHSVNDAVLQEFGLQRSAGVVTTWDEDGRLVETLQAYLTSVIDPTLVVDPTFGFVAYEGGRTLADCIESQHDLFSQRILLGRKDDIAEHLGTTYPVKNQTFDAVFLDSVAA